MQENPKPNNCYIAFECIEPKKCVHYKKMKREPNPCKKCNVVDQCDIHFAVEYCPTWIEWNDNKSLCRHNQGRYGECYNTTAHLQAITKYLKSIGVEFRIDGGCKDCANLKNPAKDVYCDCCIRQDRKKDGYVTKTPFNLKQNMKPDENFFGLQNLATNQKPLEPEFAKVVSENFFDLVGENK